MFLKEILYVLKIFVCLFLFIYLAVLGLSCGTWGLFSWSMQDLVPWSGMEPGLLNWEHSLNCWTTRQVPALCVCVCFPPMRVTISRTPYQGCSGKLKGVQLVSKAKHFCFGTKVNDSMFWLTFTFIASFYLFFYSHSLPLCFPWRPIP